MSSVVTYNSNTELIAIRTKEPMLWHSDIENNIERVILLCAISPRTQHGREEGSRRATPSSW